MSCECNNIIALSGVAEPFVLIDGKWHDLIDIKFICPTCNDKIEFRLKRDYPFMDQIDLKKQSER